jgi:hypothetical protein
MATTGWGIHNTVAVSTGFFLSMVFCFLKVICSGRRTTHINPNNGTSRGDEVHPFVVTVDQQSDRLWIPLQSGELEIPVQSRPPDLQLAEAAIINQLNAFYSQYDQKNEGKARIVWTDLRFLFAEDAYIELEKALMYKYGCNLSTFAKMKSGIAGESACGGASEGELPGQ